MTTIDTTLTERGKRYGEFAGHAKITQGMKAVMHTAPKWAALADDQKEMLDMICHKIGRVLNGDPDYSDNLTDIQGYARLVEVRLLAKEAAQNVVPNITAMLAAQKRK